MSTSSVRDSRVAVVDRCSVVRLAENEEETRLQLPRDGAAAAVTREDEVSHKATKARQVLLKPIFGLCLGISMY
jgi:hypothetical protein